LFLTVTHPFHPLSGQRLPVLFERRYLSTGLGSVVRAVRWAA
jgi:hypothetical protein